MKWGITTLALVVCVAACPVTPAYSQGVQSLRSPAEAVLASTPIMPAMPGSGLTGSTLQQPIDIVIDARNRLLAAGVDLSDHGDQTPCGPFRIVLEVAWAMRNQVPSAGLFFKPGGTRCEWPAGSGNFYAKDIVAFSDGHIVDVVGGGATDHEATWQPFPLFPGDLERYRPAIQPPALGSPDPGHTDPVPPPGDDLGVLLSLMGDIQKQLTELRAFIEEQALTLHMEHIQQEQQHGEIDKKSGGTSTLMKILGSAAAILAAIGAGK